MSVFDWDSFGPPPGLRELPAPVRVAISCDTRNAGIVHALIHGAGILPGVRLEVTEPSGTTVREIDDPWFPDGFLVPDRGE